MRIFKWILIAVVLILLLSAVGGSAVLAKVPALRDRAKDFVSTNTGERGQQAAQQISGLEFVRARYGVRSERLRGFAGEPEHVSRSTVEGLNVECWYYGIVGRTGAYQFCFVDDRLTSKFRYLR